ncbi:Bestrophin, RFP-TM, chloride channel-domain-containing protein [Phakopsora pachyrhizi]|uniref:Bestrophin, RFP-TM, chloride channel-domain-containing protein n=1 Tax=Phakopsora pachyrhizi TaxID=170000 RepID=A0AAV0BGG6_PHAPC|nr:Bestrophin, RFP-TM, chloride channel-domain-containing protein [Phakopsora pachyrhizi]CAH7686274.1 Bestrophin, RFP-TM, chloride channel-domain-containing protein [Phakopsora pachyrhizi]
MSSAVTTQPSTPRHRNSKLPRLLDSLKDLVDIEENDEGRVKLRGKVDWFGDVFRFTGSTIPQAWRAVTGFTLWAAVVAVADFVYKGNLNLSNSVIPLLSVVVGLMLVFRNTTAFGRWDDGRKNFTSLQNVVRNAARDSWISIGARGPIDASKKQGLSPHEVRLKARYLRMLVAFAVSVKRHVRGQYGIEYDDLRAVLPREYYTQQTPPGFGFDAANADVGASSTTPSSSHDSRLIDVNNDGTEDREVEEDSPLQKHSPQLPAYKRLKSIFFSQEEEIGEALSSSREPNEDSPLLRRVVSAQRLEDPSAIVIHNYLSRPSLPLPLLIGHQLQLYLAHCKQKGYLESIGPGGYNRMIQSINSMTDLFGQIDGISSNTIPASYGIHLKQCTSLYLFALPLTMASDLGWILIPLVSIVAFTLVGIEALARECEVPFGTDPSDLPLDYICADLRNEVEHMIAKLGCNPDNDLMI